MTGNAKVIQLHKAPAALLALSDEPLLRACAGGDMGALAALYDRHAPAVARFLSRLTYTDKADVEDLLQEIFLAAYQASARFVGDASVRAWIFAIAANHARMHARASLRRRLGLRAVAEAVQGRVAQDLERTVSASEQLLRLDRALKSLPHDLGVAFVLCDLEQVAGIEAAKALGVPEGTLYRRLHEARQRLRAALEGGCPG